MVVSRICCSHVFISIMSVLKQLLLWWVQDIFITYAHYSFSHRQVLITLFSTFGYKADLMYLAVLHCTLHIRKLYSNWLKLHVYCLWQCEKLYLIVSIQKKPKAEWIQGKALSKVYIFRYNYMGWCLSYTSTHRLVGLITEALVQHLLDHVYVLMLCRAENAGDNAENVETYCD